MHDLKKARKKLQGIYEDWDRTDIPQDFILAGIKVLDEWIEQGRGCGTAAVTGLNPDGASGHGARHLPLP